MNSNVEQVGAVQYEYKSEVPSGSRDYLWPIVFDELQQKFASVDGEQRRVFDLGCGNGGLMAEMADRGFHASGVDPSQTGVAHGLRRPQKINVAQGSAYDDLKATWGQFPVVVSLEVVEHIYSPRDYASTLFDLTEPDGLAIVSTPFHGYVKNVLLAVTGKLDQHFTALWDHGHIKFWSVRTLTTLLEEGGFQNIRFRFAGADLSIF